METDADDDRYRDLARRTLDHRLREHSGTCFTANLAGLELAEAGAEALPAIRDLLREIAAREPGPNEIWGLDYLIGAYFLNSGHVPSPDAAEVAAAWPAWLRKTALSGVTAFFRRDIATQRWNDAAMDQAMRFVESEISSGSEYRERALWVRERLKG